MTNEDIKMTVIEGMDVYYHPLTAKQKTCNHNWILSLYVNNGRWHCGLCGIDRELFEHLFKTKTWDSKTQKWIVKE